MMSYITKIEVEAWTRDEANAGTDDGIKVKIVFDDSRWFEQQIDNPGHDDFERGQRDRFLLDLSGTQAANAVYGQDINSIESITFIKMNGDNKWKCEAVGILVNDVVVLSRYAYNDIEYANDEFTVTLRTDNKIDGLEILVSTADVKRADTDDPIFTTVNFDNGTFTISDLRIDSTRNDFEKGDVYAYLIPLPEGPPLINYYPTDITDFSVKKDGDNGWLVKSAQLFANGDLLPIFGTKRINQFLDTSDKVLGITEWSSNNIVGPVFGCITDKSAKVTYRIEKNGLYLCKLYLHDSPNVILTNVRTIDPTGTFNLGNLLSNTHYDVKLYLWDNYNEYYITDGDGEFRTCPAEGERVQFAFGTGSCLRNRDNQNQDVWSVLKDHTLMPSVDPEMIENPIDYLRFFVHTGDTFYFYDDVIDDDLQNQEDARSAADAANLSSRMNENFQSMAKYLPTVAVWDDHDFRFNDLDSSGFTKKGISRTSFLEYWGNPPSFNVGLWGLTSRMSFGNVDIYLLDGRFQRVISSGICFTEKVVNYIIKDMEKRNDIPRLRILISGSTWNHTNNSGDQAYGCSEYENEREDFYQKLNDLFGDTINGLIFISGDIHQNEMYEIQLPSTGDKYAPEIVSSPLGVNGTGKNAREIAGERKWSSSSIDDNRGYASLHIDTKIYTGHSSWTVTVKYWKESDGTNYKAKVFTLNNNQFLW